MAAHEPLSGRVLSAVARDLRQILKSATQSGLSCYAELSTRIRPWPIPRPRGTPQLSPPLRERRWPPSDLFDLSAIRTQRALP
jgi:hypothetical protein